MRSAHPDAAYSEGRVLAAQWLGVLLGPFAWGLHLSLIYLFASVLCGPRLQAWLYGATVAALVVVAAGGFFAWRYWRLTRDQPEEDDRAVARTRFFAVMGLLGTLLFGAGVIAQMIPIALRPPC